MSDKLVTLANYPYPRAELLRGRLESEGIECVLVNVNTISNLPGYGVKVKVMEKDAQKALRIVMEIEERYGEHVIDASEIAEDLEKILVPVDFSVHSLEAARYALGLARQLKSQVMLFHAYFYPVINSIDYINTATYVFNADDTLKDIQNDSIGQMHKLAKQLIDEFDLSPESDFRLTTSLANGNPVDEILNFIDEFGPQLIIMGTRGSGEEEIHLGRTTEQIIHHTKIPLLAIPPHAHYQEIHKLNILYITDLDSTDYKAIRRLLTIVYPFEMKVFCAQVARDPVYDEVRLNNVKSHFENKYPGFEVETHLFEKGNSLELYNNYITKKEIDIVVIPHHKRGVISQMLWPDFADRFLYKTEKPLLIFRSED